LIDVMANPPNGNMCQDQDRITITIGTLPPTPSPTTPPPTPSPAPPPTTPPPTPSPTPTPEPCFVDVTLSCRTDEGQDCEDIEPRNQNCKVNFNIVVEICNIGIVFIDITKLVLTVDGETFGLPGNTAIDLLGNVVVNPLPVGECTTVDPGPTFEVDVCGGAFFFATVVDVEGNFPNNMCQADDELKIIFDDCPGGCGK